MVTRWHQRRPTLFQRILPGLNSLRSKRLSVFGSFEAGSALLGVRSNRGAERRVGVFVFILLARGLEGQTC